MQVTSSLNANAWCNDDVCLQVGKTLVLDFMVPTCVAAHKAFKDGKVFVFELKLGILESKVGGSVWQTAEATVTYALRPCVQMYAFLNPSHTCHFVGPESLSFRKGWQGSLAVTTFDMRLLRLACTGLPVSFVRHPTKTSVSSLTC
jgi:hypothetical protein